MSDANQTELDERISNIYKEHSRRVFATLVRLLGDFDRAEDALQDAFRVALEKWKSEGIPANPVAWLVSTGRFKAIDSLRRTRNESALDLSHESFPSEDDSAHWGEHEVIEDERLRLIFTCCHPAISPDAQVALTLREVCELTTEEIAHAFLIPPSTLAQRIVRAKSKIKVAKIPFDTPEGEELPFRLSSVLRVIYLIFNEGYFAASGEMALRRDLSSEAIRLAEIVVELMPEPEAIGLLALMLLHESRRAARVSAGGDLIPLDEQDRSLWDREMISRGSGLTERALRSPRFGTYGLQAAISALHSEAHAYGATDWEQIVGLYEALLRIEPTPIIELNRAVAIAMLSGPAEGLRIVESLFSYGHLCDYHLAHAAKADFNRRLGRMEQARSSYLTAIQLAQQEPERKFLTRRLAECSE